MNLHFNIDYSTVFGEELVLNIVEESGKNAGKITQYRMSTYDGLRWNYTLRLGRKRIDALTYYYSIERAGIAERREWTVMTHKFSLGAQKATDVTIYDQWNDIPEDSYLYSSAFTDCIARRQLTQPAPTFYAQTLRLQVRAPQLAGYQRLVLVGEGPALGDWDLKKAIPMVEHQHNEWVVDLDATKFEGRHLEFKFVAVVGPEAQYPAWEPTDNRTIDFPVLGKLHVVNMTKKSVEDYVASLIYPRYLTEMPNVECRIQNFRIFCLGEFNGPGVIQASNGHLNLIEAIAMCHDLTLQGRRDNIMLIRTDPNGQRTVKRFNLNDASFLASPDFELQQNDILYVQPNKSKAQASWSPPQMLNYGLTLLGTAMSLTTFILVLSDRAKN